MLLQFTVENFRSIKNQAVLSLEASSTKEHPENIINYGKERVLKGAAVFGANAAGKSNIFRAITAGVMTVRMSNTRQIGEPLFYICPYAFDNTSQNSPSKFEFVFIYDNKKYVYGFSATVQKVFTEYLYVFNSSKATTVFERDETLPEDKKYKFTINSLKSKLKPLTERNTENKLFLATSAMWNCEETKAPLMWFMEGINTFDQNYEALLGGAGQMIENDADGSLKRFMNNVLHEADINISDYEFESKYIASLPANFPIQLVASSDIKQKEYKIRAIHEIIAEDGTLTKYKLGKR